MALPPRRDLFHHLVGVLFAGAAMGRAQPGRDRRGGGRHRSGRAGKPPSGGANSIWTTIVASVLFGAFYGAYAAGLVPIDFLMAISNPPNR